MQYDILIGITATMWGYRKEEEKKEWKTGRLKHNHFNIKFVTYL